MIYEQIAAYLQENGLVQASVARKSGMTEQALSDSLRGVRRLTAEEYVAICHTLDVDTGVFDEVTGARVRGRVGKEMRA